MYQNKIFCGQFNLNGKILYGILEIKNNNISLELHDFKRELKLNEDTVYCHRKLGPPPKPRL